MHLGSITRKMIADGRRMGKPIGFLIFVTLATGLGKTKLRIFWTVSLMSDLI